jgi:hypothetical protein
MTKDSHTSMEAPGRELALGLLGSAAFGGAAAVGHGPWMAARGAWMAPALFVGGALLATPPLYMFKALAGSRQSALSTAQRCTRALAAVGTALLGLAAPAAYLSATLTTRSGPLLLLACCAVVGCAGIAAITGETLLSERKEGSRAATALWAVFAMLLGVRLLSELIKKGAS